MKSLTNLYRRIFSYTVERGYWIYAEACCEASIEMCPAKTYLADWLIWYSWIQFYLKSDYPRAAELAEEALSLGTGLRRQEFEGHRRALVAHGRAGDHQRATAHYLAALRICDRSYALASDQRVDLYNSWGDALASEAERSGATDILEAALDAYTNASGLIEMQAVPNQRELGVAKLGEGRVLLRLGDGVGAEKCYLAAAQIASRLSWLRGMAEAEDLHSELLRRAGYLDDAASAQAQAEFLAKRLRSPILPWARP